MLTNKLDTDEFDSLYQVHGVLCAFLLSVAIEIQDKVSYENTDYIRFVMSFAKNQGFRTLVHSHLNQSDYNWNFLISPGVTINGEYELLEGILSRHPNQQGQGIAFNNPEKLDKILFEDKTLRILCPLIYPDFPSKYTTAYMLQNPEAGRLRMVSTLASTAVAFLIGGLLANVIVYNAFLLSPVKEDKTDEQKAGVAFKSIGLKLSVYLYGTLVIAMVCMTYTSSYVMVYSTPFSEDEFGINFVYYTLMAYMPPICVILPLSIYAFKKSSSAVRPK
jgi:hypothetical protein